MMIGLVQQVSASPGGVPKRPLSEARITPHGIEGDSWAHPAIHGGPDQALLVIASEALNRLRAQGFPVFPGALGENLTTAGLDPKHWRSGQVYRAGLVRFEFTTVRTPCKTIEIYGRAIGGAIYDAAVKKGDFRSPLWAFSGFYARVIQEGLLRPGDPMELLSEQA